MDFTLWFIEIKNTIAIIDTKSLKAKLILKMNKENYMNIRNIAIHKEIGIKIKNIFKNLDLIINIHLLKILVIIKFEN